CLHRKGKLMNYLDEFIPTRLFEGLQTFIVAILVLLIGWLLAIIISGAVEKAFRKLKLDEKIFSKIQSGEGEQVDYNKIVGKIVFYILLIIVIIVFFNLIKFDIIAIQLSDLVSTFLLFIPAVLKAAIILDLRTAGMNKKNVDTKSDNGVAIMSKLSIDIFLI